MLFWIGEDFLFNVIGVFIKKKKKELYGDRVLRDKCVDRVVGNVDVKMFRKLIEELRKFFLEEFREIIVLKLL